MNYEEKYKKALERAKEINNEQKAQPFDIMLKVFPELKESEDGQHRKWILEYLYDGLRKSDEQFKGQFRTAIAWLEKQSNPIPDECVFRPVAGCDIELAAKQAIKQQGVLAKEVVLAFNGAYIPVKGKAQDIIVNEYNSWLEKQGEQKVSFDDFKAKDWYVSKVDGKIHNIYYSVDKIEPKFKVGDWITNGDYTWKIVEVKPLDYILQSQDGNIVDDTISHVDEQFYSFTIEDAKDGDVLCGYPEDDYPWIGIFCKLNAKGTFNSYCYLQAGLHGKFCPPSGENIFGKRNVDNHSSNVVPATKEQRDTLMKAMADAGYTFDFEKKELRKIEQKHTPKHKVGDTIYYNSFGEVKSMIVDNIVTDSTDNPMYEDKNGNAVFEKALIEQKPAWNEEDEENFRDIIGAIHAVAYQTTEDEEARINWLKSLKNRLL